MAGYVNLYIDQGADFENTIVMTDDITNEYINVSSYVVTSQMRRGYYSANASANIACAITDAANGEITMSLTANQTANLTVGRYVFDVKSNSGGTITRILEGMIEVYPATTR